MEKYKILQRFRDIHTDEVYVPDSEVEFNEERAAEINENLKGFTERIETEQDEEGGEAFDRESAKERLKELGVEFNGNAKNETLKQLLEENEEGA